MIRAHALIVACGVALSFMPARVLAAPPVPTVETVAPPLPSPKSPNKRATRELIAGGVLLGLGFAAEVSGAVISTRCKPGDWCSAAIAVSIGGPDGPNRYTFVSTGPSSTYVMGRLAAAPLLIGGFTLTMVGLASAGGRPSDWTHARKRRVAWSLFGSGLGVLVASRLMRAAFLSTGTCQAAACVHGFDQTSLWVGRGLTFAGGGLLVQGAARRTELGFGGGPFNSYGLSLSGRF
jgi:hypothetical protein